MTKLSEILKTLQNSLTEEQYKHHNDRINELIILPENLTHDELYENFSDYSHFTLRVVKRNAETYAVQTSHGHVFSKEKDEHGQIYQYERLPSGRSDEFISNTRFPLEEAVLIAEKEVAALKLMGRTLQDVKTLMEGN